MTRQQRWAQRACERVQAQHDQDHESKYRTLCMKLPVLIKQSGLVQALAFLRSRNDRASELLCDHLAEVYEQAGANGEALLRSSYEADELAAYLAMTRDMIGIAVWFRRFAQSELEGED